MDLHASRQLAVGTGSVHAGLHTVRQALEASARAFHDLRHSFGTLALASGVDLQTVSSALGHESAAITSRTYVHAIETLQTDAAARVDALLGGTMKAAITGGKDAAGSPSVPQGAERAPRQRKTPVKSSVWW